MDVKNLTQGPSGMAVGLIALAAGVVGAAVSFVVTKKVVESKYESLISEEVEKAKDHYSQRLEDLKQDDSEPLAEAEEESYSEESSEEREFVRTQPKNFKVEFTEEPGEVDRENHVQYNRIRSVYSGFDDSEDADNSMEAVEQRIMDAAKQEVQETIERSGEQLEVEGVEMFNRIYEGPIDNEDQGEGPYLISTEDFDMFDLGYSQNTLTYYELDDTLVDERDQPIPNIDDIVGRRNLVFTDQDDPNVVHIRNDHMQVDFEVCRSPGAYSEEVLGIYPSEPRRRKGSS